MERIDLNISVREQSGKSFAKKLRAQDLIPCSVYGQGDAAQSYSIDKFHFNKVTKNQSSSQIYKLVDAKEGNEIEAVVKNFQIHPLKRDLIHIDFIKVVEGSTIDVWVPIKLNGMPTEVKSGMGILQQRIYKIKLRSVPSKIPLSIDIDISEMNIGDIIRAGELDIPEGATLIASESSTVATIFARGRGITAEDMETTAGAEGEEAVPAEGDAPSEGGAEAKPDQAAEEPKE